MSFALGSFQISCGVAVPPMPRADDAGTLASDRESPVTSTLTFVPAGVSRTSIDPQARPATGHAAANRGDANQRSNRARSACHCAFPRTRPRVVEAGFAPPAAAAGRIESPPVRRETVDVSTSADERSILPLEGWKTPAPLATSLGSSIDRPPSRTDGFSISAAAFVTCQMSPCEESVADARSVPPQAVRSGSTTSTKTASLRCHCSTSPSTERSAAMPVEEGAA